MSLDHEIHVVKLLYKKIKNHCIEIPWPPEDIPKLLDTFCTILMSGQALDRDKSRFDRIVHLKNSLAPDISVSNGAIKMPQSVLIPFVVKALCNNTEVLRLINKCGHGISYNLIDKIETDLH